MEKELEQFQQEAQRLKQGRKGGALPFPEALRAFAVRYAEQTLEAGGTVVEAAARLGVSAPTLYEWRKGRTAGSAKRKKRTERSQVLVPVRVETILRERGISIPPIATKRGHESRAPAIAGTSTDGHDKCGLPPAAENELLSCSGGPAAERKLVPRAPIRRPEVEKGTRKSHRHRCGSDPRSPDRPCAPRIAHPAIETPRFRKIVSSQLYAIEEDLPDWHALEGQAQQDALAHRLTVRQQHSAPLVERIKAWALAQKALPGSTFRKALEYMLELWNGLTLFLLNPRVPLDNNHVERQMRDMVLGRKNHYGSKSQPGTEVAALFYSLIETARLRGEDPGDYLLRAALAAIENPGTVTLPNSFD